VTESAATAIHPAAPEHLPPFITMPGNTDILMTAMGVFLVAAVFGFGLLYLKLHSLPEHMARGSSKTQFQIVGVLALLALFTHNHLFWIAALLVALVQLPDFSGPINSMARSLDRLADRDGPREADAPPPAALDAAEAAPEGPEAPPVERSAKSA
jgi:hypothetical protein